MEGFVFFSRFSIKDKWVLNLVCVFVGLLGSPGWSEAQVVDRVELVPTTDAVEIQVVFNTPVVYQFHLPEKSHSNFIQIHLVLPDVNSTTNLTRERNSSPPSEVLPRFTVVFPDQETRRTKSLAFRFDRAVPFNVLGTRGRNTVVLQIPITPSPQLAPSTQGMSPSETKNDKNIPSGSQAPLPAETRPQPPVSEIIKKEVAPNPQNSVLDHIEVLEGTSDEEIHVLFKTPVRYLYHFPLQPSPYVRIHLVFPDLPKTLNTGVEHWTSPPTGLVSPFSIDFLDQETSVTKRMTITFSESSNFTIRGRGDGKGIVIALPRKTTPPKSDQVVPSPLPPTSSSVPAPSTPESIQTRADELMEQGQAALAAGDSSNATKLFNAILMLPPTRHSEAAQELVGLAREKSGELDKARIEYEVFLKLYPDSEGATRVRQRLEALQQQAQSLERPSLQIGSRSTTRPEISLFGNLTQYYFGGHSSIESTTINGNVSTTNQQSLTDQSSLVSSLNLTGRHRHNEYDTKIILRGTDTMDFLGDGQEAHQQRVRRAYVQHEDRELAYMLLLGRQPGNSGGIFGTFDGGWARYDLLPLVGLNLVGGFPEPVGINSNFKIDTGRYFVGTNVDLHPENSSWSSNVYFMNQVADTLLDRRAVGGEFRYFENGRSLFSLVDVDISYRVLNIAMVNGSWLTEWGTTFTFLVDRRKTPSMETSNALIGNGASSIKQALTSLNEQELRRQAEGITADSNLFLLGFTHPVTTTWQVGGEARWNYTSETEAVGLQPAIPASGNILTYTLQTTGTDFLVSNHTLSLIGSYIDNPTFQGQSLVLTSLFQFEDQWQINSTVSVYHQQDQTGTQQIRVTPNFRIAYRWKENMTFEMEGGIEQNNVNSTFQEDNTLRDFFSFGYVWQR